MRRIQGKKEIKVRFIDVRKAHLNAVCEEEEWVELPEAFWKWGRFARLRKWFYGMRKAASGWEDDHSRRLVSEGCGRGIGSPTVFYNRVSEVRVVVHGDDFTMSGTKEELEKVKRKMESWYDIKDRGTMGSGAGEVKEITILGRTIRWTDEGIEYEADPKHRKELMAKAGLTEESKAAIGPVLAEKEEDKESKEDWLEAVEKKTFRGQCALLN